MMDPRDQGEAIKSLPSNIEAEQALLGILMFDNAVFERLPDGLRGSHFFEPFHQRLFDAISESITAGAAADPTILMTRFTNDPAFSEFGGLRYLADLVDRAPPGSNAKDYARSIYDLAIRRELIRIGGEIIANAPDPDRPAKDLLSEAEGALYGLAETGSVSEGVQIFSSALDGAMQAIEGAFRSDGQLTGIATTLVDLDQKLGGLHDSDLLILAGRPSMGKAQPLHSKVLLADGTWREMGGLAVGDALASVDGQPSTVTGVFPQGKRQVYRLTLSDGRSTLACGEHLWTAECSKWTGRRRTLSTNDIAAMLEKERYQRRISLPMVSGDFGADGDLPIHPWLLGALLGNGNFAGSCPIFSTADAATLFRVQKIVGSDRVHETGSDYDYRIVANDCAPEHNIRFGLMKLGLAGRQSHDKFVPSPYLSGSRETRLAVLQGLIDTDGWVETFGAVRIALASKQMAEDVQALVRSLGGLCTISLKNPTFSYRGVKKEGRPSFVCNISHPERSALMTLTRKARRCEREMRYRAPTIVSVEPVGIEPVQCIAVSHPDHLYVTDDYIVTHNTALATNIAFNVAKNYRWIEDADAPDGRKTVAGGRVLFASLEMSKEQLAQRILADASGVSSDRMRKGQINEAEFRRIRECRDLIDKIPLHIDATGGLHIAKLAARARRHKRKFGLELIVVDYLQLVTTDGAKGNGRVQEVTAITGGLKALAKELNVPIIALSQLSRQVEQRDDKRPQLSDLRESGSIEQDADAVMFVYRESYYLSRSEPKEGTAEHMEWQAEMAIKEHEAEVIIGKQRHGPIGTVKLAFDADTTRFGNLARGSDYETARMPYGDA